MRVKLNKDKVIGGSVWLIGSELDLSAEEARKLIEAGDAEAMQSSSDAGEEEPKQKRKRKAKEE